MSYPHSPDCWWYAWQQIWVDVADAKLGLLLPPEPPQPQRLYHVDWRDL